MQEFWRKTMEIARGRFNLYLAAALTCVVAGCSSTKDPNEKLSTLLRVHLEPAPNAPLPRMTVAVNRSNPLVFEVESMPLLSEQNVVEAAVIEEMGLYSIRIKFDHWAQALLDYNSTSHQGLRLAIQAQFGPKQETSRWIGAPKLDRHITDATITFTPDASLEECYEIVTGLNNDARKTKKRLDW